MIAEVEVVNHVDDIVLVVTILNGKEDKKKTRTNSKKPIKNKKTQATQSTHCVSGHIGTGDKHERLADIHLHQKALYPLYSLHPLGLFLQLIISKTLH